MYFLVDIRDLGGKFFGRGPRPSLPFAFRLYKAATVCAKYRGDLHVLGPFAKSGVALKRLP